MNKKIGSKDVQEYLMALIKNVMVVLTKDVKKDGYTLIQNGIVYYDGQWQIKLMWQNNETYEVIFAGHWRV